MSRFKPSGELQIESASYAWSVRHYGGASTPYENLRGVSASVRLQAKITKELIIDFPLRDYFFSKPRSTAAFEERLRKCIRGAIDRGWKPDSKGKPFRVAIEEVEGLLGP